MQDNDWATIKLRWTGLWERYVLGRGERVSPEEQSLNFLGHLEVYRFAAQFVRDREVLDVGCGTGYGCDHLRQAGARSVTGIDIARTAVRYARRHYPDPRLTFERMNAEVLRYSDARFDLVMSFENLEHLPKPERCLAEIRRVLRPGGLLVLATPNKELSSPGLSRCLNPYHLREYYFDELDALLRRYFAEVVIFETTFDGSQEAQRLKADRRERGRIGLESGDQNSLMVGPWTVSRNHQKNSHSFLALAWG